MTFRLLVGVASMLLLQNSAWQCDAFVYVSYPPAGAQCISRSGITSNAINVGISGGGPSAGAAALQVTAVQAYPAGVVGGRGSITALSAFPDRSNHDDIVARNIARTDVRNFLTQRAFQSFMFLAEECRDPHTGKWIQDFLGLQNMLEYHGSGALDIDRFRMWEASLVEMMEQPKDTVIVSAKRRGRGHGGWSKNNPYLPERWVEIPISIDPTSLTQRIMAVREQIGGEFVNDLAILRECNDMILDDYFAKVKATRDEQQQQGQNVESYSYMDDPSRVNPTAIAFDRVGANILNNHTAFASVASSPFRRGNFDLLYNLATQESVHKLLRSLQAAGEAKIVSFPAEAEKPVDDITSDAEEKESIDEPPATAEVSTKSKNTQLLEDLENKQKERNAKMDKLRDFEVYLASVKSCASNEEDVVVTCDTSKEDGEKDLVAESEDVAKIDAATEDKIASPEPEPEPASADAEAVIISSESEGETEVSLSGSDTAAKQNATADEPAAEAEKSADIEIETPTMDDTTSTLKSDDTEDEKAIGAVVSAEKTLTFASMEESDTLQEAPTTDEGCAVNFTSTVKEGLEVFAATVVASCMPTPDVTGNNKSEDSAEEGTKESTEEEEPKELAEETEVPTDDVATEEESEETNEQLATEEQTEPKPESVEEVGLTAVASSNSAVGEKLAEIDESSVESAKEEEKKENYPAESIEIVDEAAQLPVAKEAAIEAEADAAQPTPAKKSTMGKKKFSSVKKIFKKKGKKYEL